MTKYKVLFIDLDDTLWDFRGNARAALQDIYAVYELGQYFESFEQFFELYSVRNAELWGEYHKGTITKADLQRERFLYPFAAVGVRNEALSERVGSDFLERTTTKTTLVPGAIELLDYLSEKYLLTILSNGFSEVQYKKIDNTGLRKYFEHIVLSEDIGIQKPNIEIFQHALELNGVMPSEVMMIGDNHESDVLGAANAGIDQIYFAPNGADDAKQATHTVTSLLQIMTIL